MNRKTGLFRDDGLANSPGHPRVICLVRTSGFSLCQIFTTLHASFMK